MLSGASALSVGPSDWQRDVIPRQEYVERIAAVRAILKTRGIDGLLVPGGVVQHGALAYLTGFTPKLQPAFALLPTAGPVRVFYSGPPGMRPSVARQTWIDDLRPAGSIERDLLAWTRESHSSGTFALGLWDGWQLSANDEKNIRCTIGEIGRMEELSDQLDALPRRKRAVERRIIGGAAKLIGPAIDSIHYELLAGQTIRRAILAAERDAYARGAQEVRILASRRPGGMPVAFDALPESTAGSINVYLAVRMFGYWVDAHATVGEMTGLTIQAEADLEEAINCLRRSLVVHQASSTWLRCHGIGLSLSEAPQFQDRIELQEGDVCSIVVERGTSEAFGFASALVLAEGDELKTIWRVGDRRSLGAAASE